MHSDHQRVLPYRYADVGSVSENVRHEVPGSRNALHIVRQKDIELFFIVVVRERVDQRIGKRGQKRRIDSGFGESGGLLFPVRKCIPARSGIRPEGKR